MGNLSPRQKKILAALGAAGVLALVVLMGRRGSSAPDASQLGAASGTPVSFGDTGGGYAGQTADWTSAFGSLQTSVDALNENLPDAVGGAVAAAIPVQPAGVTSEDVTAAVTSAFANWSGTPSGAANSAPRAAANAAKAAPQPSAHQTAAAAAPNVSFQTSGSRAGRNFKTVVKDGKVYRFYESKPGSGDWGAKPGTKVYVRPASGGSVHTP